MICRHELRLTVDEMTRRTGLTGSSYLRLEQGFPQATDYAWSLLTRIPVLRPIIGGGEVSLDVHYLAGSLRERIGQIDGLPEEEREVALARIRFELSWWDQAVA